MPSRSRCCGRFPPPPHFPSPLPPSLPLPSPTLVLSTPLPLPLARPRQATQADRSLSLSRPSLAEQHVLPVDTLAQRTPALASAARLSLAYPSHPSDSTFALTPLVSLSSPPMPAVSAPLTRHRVRAADAAAGLHVRVHRRDV